ncbi:hypothetical protein SFUMM280S_07832 [Streptomyces fumanus]
MTSCFQYTPGSLSRDLMSARSAAGMCLAASIRKPSTPSESRSSRYPAMAPRTVALAGVQVGEADQFAVLDVGAVGVVADLRGAVVETS